MTKEITFNRLYKRLVGRAHVYFDKRFDRKHNVETCENVNISQIKTQKPLFQNYDIDELYSGTPVLLFDALHELIDAKDREQITYIDIGAGKARMMMQAMEAGFKNLCGVEFVPALAQAGRENISTFQDREQIKADWEIIAKDARTLNYPKTDMVIYLFNPFDPPVFKEFLDNLVQDLKLRPRKMILIYNHSHCADMLDDSPELERVNYPFLAEMKLKCLSLHDYGAWQFNPASQFA